MFLHVHLTQGSLGKQESFFTGDFRGHIVNCWWKGL